MSIDSKKRIAAIAWWNNITQDERNVLKERHKMLVPTGRQIQQMWELEHDTIPRSDEKCSELMELIRDEVSMGTFGLVELTLREAVALSQLEAAIDEEH